MSFETTDPAGAKSLLEGPEPHRYLDVRSVEEFEAGHVPGAYNLPLLQRSPAGGLAPNPDFAEVATKVLDPGDPWVVGCAAGGRSARACELMGSLGFTTLVNMHGGFSGARDAAGNLTQEGWAGAGFPTTNEVESGRDWASLRREALGS